MRVWCRVRCNGVASCRRGRDDLRYRDPASAGCLTGSAVDRPGHRARRPGTRADRLRRTPVDADRPARRRQDQARARGRARRVGSVRRRRRLRRPLAVPRPRTVLAEVARALGLHDVPGGSPSAAWRTPSPTRSSCSSSTTASRSSPQVPTSLLPCARAPGCACWRPAGNGSTSARSTRCPAPPWAAGPRGRARDPAGSPRSLRSPCSSRECAVAQPDLRSPGRTPRRSAISACGWTGSAGARAHGGAGEAVHPQRARHPTQSSISLLTSNVRDAPARHRTLRAALQWSHELLDPHERALFRRLSVFVGPWTLDVADRVCGEAGLDILETVASLIDKSLVRRSASSGDVALFGMLESLREYAAEHLATQDDLGVTRDRHATYFAALAAEQEARIGLPQNASGGAGRPRPTTPASSRPSITVSRPGNPGDLADRSGAGLALVLPGHLGTGRDQVSRALADVRGRPAGP